MSEENVFQNPQPQKLENLSNKLGFDIPVEAVPLPSNGLLYSPDHPLCNADSVEIKCMTAKEEDILTSQALIRKGIVIDALIQSCLINKTVDPNTLLLGDRNALLIALRVTGYGPEHTARITCPLCGEAFENTFNFSSLKIKRLGAAPVEANTNLFSYVLPVSKLEVKFKLLTAKESQEINDYNEKKKKLGVQTDGLVTSRLLFTVVSIAGIADRTKLAPMISNMIARDARALRAYMSKIEPDVDMNQTVKCSHCNKESEVEMPLGASFFWPDVAV